MTRDHWLESVVSMMNISVVHTLKPSGQSEQRLIWCCATPGEWSCSSRQPEQLPGRRWGGGESQRQSGGPSCCFPRPSSAPGAGSARDTPAGGPTERPAASVQSREETREMRWRFKTGLWPRLHQTCRALVDFKLNAVAPKFWRWMSKLQVLNTSLVSSQPYQPTKRWSITIFESGSAKPSLAKYNFCHLATGGCVAFWHCPLARLDLWCGQLSATTAGKKSYISVTVSALIGRPGTSTRKFTWEVQLFQFKQTLSLLLWLLSLLLLVVVVVDMVAVILLVVVLLAEVSDTNV